MNDITTMPVVDEAKRVSQAQRGIVGLEPFQLTLAGFRPAGRLWRKDQDQTKTLGTSNPSSPLSQHLACLAYCYPACPPACSDAHRVITILASP